MLTKRFPPGFYCEFESFDALRKYTVSEEHMKYVLFSSCRSWVRSAVMKTDGLILCRITLRFSIVINDLRPVTVDSLVYDFEASEDL